MILRGLRLVKRNQKGFTIIELLVALAITGLLASGLSATIFQILSGNAQSSSQMNVVRQVQSAGYWISQDTLMAQLVTPSGATGFPLTLNWTEWDGTVIQVIYSITGDGELKRTISVDGAASGDTLVAQYIDQDPAKTNCVYSGAVLTLTVTADVGGYRPANETRIYDIIPRPNT